MRERTTSDNVSSQFFWHFPEFMCENSMREIVLSKKSYAVWLITNTGWILSILPVSLLKHNKGANVSLFRTTSKMWFWAWSWRLYAVKILGPFTYLFPRPCILFYVFPQLSNMLCKAINYVNNNFQKKKTQSKTKSRLNPHAKNRELLLMQILSTPLLNIIFKTASLMHIIY